MIQAGSGLLYPALRKAGVTLGPGRGPSVAQLDDALGELNRLMSSLHCDPLFIYSQTLISYLLTGGQAAYTIGIANSGQPPADILAQRPIEISAANIVDAGFRSPLAIATAADWANRWTDTATGYPSAIYNDAAAPLSTLTLWPTPSASFLLELNVWHEVPAFLTSNDVVNLPSGYEDALVLNLAIRLCPQFQKPIDSNLRADARESLARVLSLNAPQPVLHVGDIGACGGSGYNIYQDA